MQAKLIRIFLILFLFAVINPSLLSAATEQRIALVIGNGAYSAGPLKNPVNDATDMATALKRAGFTVTLKKNANLQEMVEAIENFGNNLKRGGVGLFYYAGHGVQVSSVNYLLPVSSKINKESDVRFQAVDAGRVLAEMENANNGLNIVILDACRDNPFGKSFRSSSRGLAIVANAPSGTFISYSTGAGQVASDGEGKNSPYTRALLENISKPGLTINKVFMNVRSKVKKETGQVPWELSSLEGDFFFVPGTNKTATDIIQPGKIVIEKTEPVADSLDEETMKLEDEDRKLEKEKVLLEKKKALEDKRQKIEEEKATLEGQKTTTLAMSKRPAFGETDRDGRFIAYSNGTVLDTRTNLMWAAKDNGSIINWANAKSYCENYRGGGYSDWRMPAQDELAGLYDGSINGKHGYHLTNLIDITRAPLWASETRNALLFSEHANFTFHNGLRHWFPQYYDNNTGVLPVRSGK